MATLVWLIPPKEGTTIHAAASNTSHYNPNDVSQYIDSYLVQESPMMYL